MQPKPCKFNFQLKLKHEQYRYKNYFSSTYMASFDAALPSKCGSALLVSTLF